MRSRLDPRSVSGPHRGRPRGTATPRSSTAASRPRTTRVRPDALRSLAAHGPARHAPPGDVNPVLHAHLGVDARRAVRLTRRLVDRPNPLGEQLVLPRAGGRSPVSPGVLPSPGDPHDATQRADTVIRLLRLNEPVHAWRVGRSSSAKKAAAFRRISRSSRTILFSRFKRRISALSSTAAGFSRFSAARTHCRIENALTPSSSASFRKPFPLSR